MVFSFFWNTIQHKTLYVWDFILTLTPTQHEIFLEVKTETEEIDKKIVMSKFEEFLLKNPENLFQEESIYINTNINIIWETITDWNVFKHCVPSIADSVVYEGPPAIKDTILHVYIPSKNNEYHMKVIKSEITEEKREFALHFYAGVPKAPKQDLIFTLLPIEENSCLVKFRHDFRQYVNSKQISYIENEKKGILAQLKSSLEAR
jgi:carbon monoxide dehydrogenase subunit G